MPDCNAYVTSQLLLNIPLKIILLTKAIQYCSTISHGKPRGKRDEKTYGLDANRGTRQHHS